MKEIFVDDRTAGGRLDKFLARVLPDAPVSFFYKMLRKKNITLNGKKAAGNEKLASGDVVRLYLSDETFRMFAGEREAAGIPDLPEPEVLYEDQDIILINKPAGLLSQKAGADDISAVETVTAHLIRNGSLDTEDPVCFMPAVAHRLDRNTSGILAAGKTLSGLQYLNRVIRARDVKKQYLACVCGACSLQGEQTAWLSKDKASNTVSLSDEQKNGAVQIRTRFISLKTCRQYTLVEAELITGKPHQIRAHLAHLGYPILGDPKYGDAARNREARRKYGLRHQMLHAWKLTFPEEEGHFSYLSGRTFEAPVPELFNRIMEREL